jgi:hypothetical protein
MPSWPTWNLFDATSAFLKAKLKTGSMRIPKTIATYASAAAHTTTPFHPSDGSPLFQLQKVLHDLSESGSLCHELMTEILGRIGYDQCPGDSCPWRRSNSIILSEPKLFSLATYFGIILSTYHLLTFHQVKVNKHTTAYQDHTSPAYNKPTKEMVADCLARIRF